MNTADAINIKINSLIEETIESMNVKQKKERDDAYHKYSDNTRAELELLLKHHNEDLQEYIDRGDDAEAIEHIKEDIREIEIELKKQK